MQRELELSVIVTSYQRPGHVERSLVSLAKQRGVDGRFEVIVADDGSDDGTAEMVARFAGTVDFPVKFTTHPHEGYRVSLSRNEGVRASQAPYLLFTDGDCVFPPDHLHKHLLARRPGVVQTGDCIRLDRMASESLDLAAVAAGEFQRLVTFTERRRMAIVSIKNRFYQWTHHKLKPKLTACNIGIWRRDFEAVNGFDENFVGWGCEDDDLGVRLRAAGLRVSWIFGTTQTYHLWHPLDVTHPGAWRSGANVGRLLLASRPVRCRRGLVNLGGSELGTRIEVDLLSQSGSLLSAA